MIRRAIESDYEQVKFLKERLSLDVAKLSQPEYRYSIQKSGFLISSEYSAQDHSDDMKKIFFVYEENGKVLAYLRVDETHEMKDDVGTYWYMPEFHDIYFASPHACVGGVGVLPDAEGRGIGTALLLATISELKKKGIKYLFAFISMAPVTNVPSMLFHEKHGFERVMYSEPESLFGMKDYQCFVYAKRI